MPAKCRSCASRMLVHSRAGALTVTLAAPRDIAARAVSADAPKSSPSVGPRNVSNGNGAVFMSGDRVGRYEIEDVVGRGGMGTVYKAYDPTARRHVALKSLVPQAQDLDVLRFEREIAVQGNIQHPNIMPIFDSGVVGKTRYYTMELLHQPLDLIDITALVHEGEAASDPALARIATITDVMRTVILPLCRAIHHANTKEGVLHRDIKPGNVMVDRSELRPYLIDFGVASLLRADHPRLADLDKTLPVPLRGEGVHVAGTLVFMPPEQARGEAHVTGDVWGLGAVMHYIVSGEAPLESAKKSKLSRSERVSNLKMLIVQAKEEGNLEDAKQYRSMLERVRTGEERSLDDLRRDVLRGHYKRRPPGVEPGLDAMIAKAMHPDPDQRYETAGALHDALSQWLDERQPRSRRGGNRVAATTGGGGWRPLIAAGLIGLLLGAAAGYFWPENRADLSADRDALLDRVDMAMASGLLDDARAATRDAIALDAAHERSWALLDEIDRRERVAAVQAECNVLARRTARANAEERVAIAGQLSRLIEGTYLPLLRDDERNQVQAEIDAWRALADVRCTIRLQGMPEGTVVRLCRVDTQTGRVQWDGLKQTLALQSTGDTPYVSIAPGRVVLVFERSKDKHTHRLMVPVDARRPSETLALTCPADPLTIPSTMQFVSRATPETADLLVDRKEVTGAEYAVFLATLPPAEQRQRVPRSAGALGLAPHPIWDRVGETFEPSAYHRARPVEGICLDDARAYARHVGKRLPTFAEWQHIARGGDDRPTAIGAASNLSGTRVHVNATVAGAEVGPTGDDVNPYGIADLTGNVSEFTTTQRTWAGVHGFLVAGGSYARGASAALIDEARPVPSWMPQDGVGFRCVREAPAK